MKHSRDGGDDTSNIITFLPNAIALDQISQRLFLSWAQIVRRPPQTLWWQDRQRHLIMALVFSHARTHADMEPPLQMSQNAQDLNVGP